ncbi:MAG: hypothetical protein ACRBG0_27485 [Lewinella sp.]|jgi:hypothetical protein|uniref:hypothetical protein n=1 Tax=Lewinella sp. TaxID=2004506 RepID=UPI003D6BF627
MTTQGSFQFGGNNKSPFQGIVGIVVAILFFFALFYFVQILFKILWFLLPVMVIATAIIDHKVILNYFGWIGKLFKSNAVAGIAMSALTIIGAPVVSLFLLGKALLRKKIKDVQTEADRQQNGEFVEYEELDSETMDLPTLEPPLRADPPPKNDTGYDDMFR